MRPLRPAPRGGEFLYEEGPIGRPSGVLLFGHMRGDMGGSLLPSKFCHMVLGAGIRTSWLTSGPAKFARAKITQRPFLHSILCKQSTDISEVQEDYTMLLFSNTSFSRNENRTKPCPIQHILLFVST